jgi:outer membrane protein OmpU
MRENEMKKLLIATTALVATAGVAAADVSTSGDGRMGVKYDGANTELTSRVRIKFAASGETDGGLAFGGSFGANDVSKAAEGTKGSVFISGAFGKLSMGDVSTGAKAATGNVSGVGLTGLDGNAVSFGSQTDPSVLYSFSTDAISVYASVGQLVKTNQQYGIGVKYSADTFSVGLGHSDDGATTTTAVAASVSFGDATVKASYADNSANTSGAQYALSVDYAFGATAVTAFYADAAAKAYGIGASYDLGGGASLKGGVVDNGANTVTDFGLTFSF